MKPASVTALVAAAVVVVALAIALPLVLLEHRPSDVTASSAGADVARESAPDDGASPESSDGGDARPAGPEAGGRRPEAFDVVRLDPSSPAPLQIAVQACAGLYNRRAGGSIYVRRGGGGRGAAKGDEAGDGGDGGDDPWPDLLGLPPPRRVLDGSAFLEDCLSTENFPGCARYSYSEHRKLLPSVLTAAAALEAVPLDVDTLIAAADGGGSGRSAAYPCGAALFDAAEEFRSESESESESESGRVSTPLLATERVMGKFLRRTSGLAMLNPGYELWDPPDPAQPALSRDMPGTMVDLVFSRGLFVVFLVGGCTPGHPERELLQRIVDRGVEEANWTAGREDGGGEDGGLLGVYGYNNAWHVAGGFIYEAQTRCLDSRNLGAIPTEAENLSFWSTSARRAPIAAAEAGELKGTAPIGGEEAAKMRYNGNKTYVAFVVGDGDNVQYVLATRREWFWRRLDSCRQLATVGYDKSCPPLTWSISPHLLYLAPDILEWYFNASRTTGKDHFILPPSGHLYAYPASLKEEAQDAFVAATERDARLLGVRGTVHWDWFGTWNDALETVLPKYAKKGDGGAIRGVFAMNVPYMADPFPSWASDEFFRVLRGEDGGRVAVFRPRIWRGVDGRGDGPDEQYFLRPEDMAAELGEYPRGTVTWVYMSSDGGLTLENSFLDMAGRLPEHVQLVGTDEAARLALEAAAAS